MTSDRRSVIRIEDLQVFFRRSGLARERGLVKAVDGVGLNVFEGETLCIVGESGSGKTTLVRAVARLVAITNGRIFFDDLDVTALKRQALRRFRRHVQIVFQDPYEALNPRHSVSRVIVEALQTHGVGKDKQEQLDLACEALEACGLSPATEFLDKYPHELSGGQRQRVCIAAATALKPTVLIADEPVSMLDVSVRAGILRLLRNLSDERSMTLILVTHDLSLAWAMADRVAVMYGGKVLELGPAQRVIREPANPYTEALVSAIPIADPSHTPVEAHVRDARVAPDWSGGGCRFHPRCMYGVSECEIAEPPLVAVEPGHYAACIRTNAIREELREGIRRHLDEARQSFR